MNETLKKTLAEDPDGLLTYEYIANHIGKCDDIMGDLVGNMIEVDSSGQFVVSAVRYLYAIDPVKYAPHIDRLIASAIDKDRERRYLADLLTSIWGTDYEERLDELNNTDDNFRRIYKRLTPARGF